MKAPSEIQTDIFVVFLRNAIFYKKPPDKFCQYSLSTTLYDILWVVVVVGGYIFNFLYLLWMMKFRLWILKLKVWISLSTKNTTIKMKMYPPTTTTHKISYNVVLKEY